jgi:hypothetical protein
MYQHYAINYIGVWSAYYSRHAAHVKRGRSRLFEYVYLQSCSDSEYIDFLRLPRSARKDMYLTSLRGAYQLITEAGQQKSNMECFAYRLDMSDEAIPIGDLHWIP